MSHPCFLHKNKLPFFWGGGVLSFDLIKKFNYFDNLNCYSQVSPMSGQCVFEQWWTDTSSVRGWCLFSFQYASATRSLLWLLAVSASWIHPYRNACEHCKAINIEWQLTWLQFKKYWDKVKIEQICQTRNSVPEVMQAVAKFLTICKTPWRHEQN